MSFMVDSNIRRGTLGPHLQHGPSKWEILGVQIAICGPLGKVPRMPGTVASLLGLLIHLGLQGIPYPAAWGVLVGLCLVGIWSAGCAERVIGLRDPPQVVIDEVVGMALALAGLGRGILTLCMGFALFRLLDVLKPPPIRTLERHLPGGWAVVGDDLAAALGAQVGLRLMGLVWPSSGS